MSIMQTIVTILHVWHTSFAMRMILTQALQQGYAPGHYPGSLRWPNYLPQMALCNSGKIAVTYYNIYLPTTDGAVQQPLL